MAKYINKYPTDAEYTEDTAARDALGKTVSLIDSTGDLHYDVGNKTTDSGDEDEIPTVGY